MAFWATQAELEARILASRLKNWGDRDRDGLIDSTVLTLAFQEAQGVCCSFLAARFGGYLSTWTSTTVPYLVKACYIDVALWSFASASNQISPSVQKRYEDALKTLGSIRDHIQDIFDETNSTVLTEATPGFGDLTITPEQDERLFDFDSTRMPTQARAFEEFDTCENTEA